MKNLLDLGVALTKDAQKRITGGQLTAQNNCLLNGCPSGKICTEVFHDPDGGGPLGEQSQWVCISPVNHK